MSFSAKNDGSGTHTLLSAAIGALCVCGIGYVTYGFYKHSIRGGDKKGDAGNRKRRFGSPNRSAQEQAPVVSARITRLFVHPVKSCRGYECSSAEVLPRGLRYDREWVVVRRRDSKVMTIREIPAMRRVWAEIATSAGGSAELVLSYRPLDESTNEASSGEPTSTVRISITPSGGKSVTEDAQGIDIDIWGMAGTVRDEGKAASDFLTAVFNNDGAVGSASHEVYYLGRMVQPRNPKLSGGSSAVRVLDDELRIRAQDGSSLHILTEESMLWVKKEVLAEREGLPTPTTGPLAQLTDPELYRPNIVVEGVPFPEEDRWDTMTIKKKEVSSPAEEEVENVADDFDNTSEPYANVKSADSSLNRRQRKGQHVYLKTAKICDRCAIPTTSLDGVRDKGFQPTRFLREHHAIAAAGKPNRGLLGLNVNVRLRADDGASSPSTSTSTTSANGSPSKVSEGSSSIATIDERDDETVLGVISVGDELLVTAFRDAPDYV